MTNSTAQWEQAVLNKLTSNGERIAVVENRLDRIETDLSDLKSDMSEVKETTKQIRNILGWLKWIGGGIAAITQCQLR